MGAGCVSHRWFRANRIVSMAFDVMHQIRARHECAAHVHMKKRHIERCTPDMPSSDAACEST
ncbi:hypothetical protein BED46_012950 [Burkholderia contaminans]|uniref:Uncharacterized protein n=1 Tax=Burkholderia contaminans LMG 23361 TaxID=1334628 RepID=A0ABD4AK39_9BURK|nr:hypothetical protein WR31_30565 [Burkholderia contaminans LMG 23361]MBA9838644.1 hypothetical protein [Burkholderia contaminans]MBA9863960.1 hypothetical protein [Burkholderia contaminans]MBA9930289.1 hypothetical protein [Burkholderia contaminans]MCB4327628.1 hypothetical protein [Burkholderia contaminans]